jgi:hypothetical protein
MFPGHLAPVNSASNNSFAASLASVCTVSGTSVNERVEVEAPMAVSGTWTAAISWVARVSFLLVGNQLLAGVNWRNKGVFLFEEAWETDGVATCRHVVLDSPPYLTQLFCRQRTEQTKQ